jgi:hypothetical protein
MPWIIGKPEFGPQQSGTFPQTAGGGLDRGPQVLPDADRNDLHEERVCFDWQLGTVSHVSLPFSV